MIDLRELGTITSGFGQRDAPTAGASTKHKGLDIVLNNYNVPAVEGGVVTYSGYSESGGNMVEILHTDGVTARYLHLANPSNLKSGQAVNEGDIIGVMGSTGYSTGDHLHIDFNRYGVTIDPNEYFNSGGSGSTINIKTDTSDDGLTLVGKIIEFVAVLLVVVLAVVLFMKAFDIHIK